jgi:hypothetical protein
VVISNLQMMQPCQVLPFTFITLDMKHTFM